LYYAQQVLGRIHIIAVFPAITVIGNATIRAQTTYDNANMESANAG
jgi:hypothetical protein